MLLVDEEWAEGKWRERQKSVTGDDVAARLTF